MATASRKVIISFAVTGSIHKPTMTPYLPITADEIAAGTIAACGEAGEGCGTRFEFVCYDIGHLYNLAHFLKRGLVKPPLHPGKPESGNCDPR